MVQVDHSALVTLLLDQLYRIGNWRYRMAEKEGPRVVIRLAHGGNIGAGPELSASLLGIVFHLPNIWIATPTRPYHAKGLLKTALRTNHPIVFFEHKQLYENIGWVPKEEYTVTFGTSTVFTAGTHVTAV